MSNRTFPYQIHISSQGKLLVEADRFDIPRHQITFLFGESGIGKSIISKAIYGLLDPQELDVVVNGIPYEAYLKTRQVVDMQADGFFVFQEPSSHLNPLMKLQDQLREGTLAQARTEPDILNQLWETTRGTGIKELLRVYPQPHRPSGGEKQRFLLAMAFKKIELYIIHASPSEQTMFVFDEPTGSLDNETRNLFLAFLFNQFRRRPFTTLLITHDYSMISEVFKFHTDLVDSIVFKELTLKKNRLQLNEFSPESYLKWIKKNQASPSSHKARKSRRSPKDILLRLESGISVFGRRLILSRYARSKNASPLIIRRHQIVYLNAPSGVGKTTLAKLIMGLMRGQNFDMHLGEIRLTDATPTQFWQQLWGRKMGMVFQHADEALNLNARVKDIFAGLPYPEHITSDYVHRKLEEHFPLEVDYSFLNRPIKYLSGGQKQRLNLLRTLSLDTELLILDEPLNGLDFVSIKKMIDLLLTKQEEGKGILLISHNEEIFDSLGTADRVYLRAEGE
jgi:ABC-type glutathione transport system ATPase component